ncbi:hypothetical protein DL98DRAFT_514945 [Cadophora sp. DSE1049]|nr:hypothetical protein DL98DRAFT_514945 [Cadophora sp. DSE1049]
MCYTGFQSMKVTIHCEAVHIGTRFQGVYSFVQEVEQVYHREPQPMVVEMPARDLQEHGFQKSSVPSFNGVNIMLKGGLETNDCFSPSDETEAVAQEQRTRWVLCPASPHVLRLDDIQDFTDRFQRSKSAFKS